MCTIIIHSGKVQKDKEEAFKKDLVNVSSVAERQGAGAAGIMGYRDEPFYVGWKKRPMRCGDFVHDTVITPLDIMAIHARSGYNYPDDRDYDKHHHPFVGDNIHLMHEGYASGSSSDWFKVAAALGINLETKTDSELIMRLIQSKDNLIDGIRYAIDILGEWVMGCAIYDNRTPYQMHFFCLESRCSPYDIVTLEDYNTTMLISSVAMLVDAQVNVKSSVGVKPMHLYSFDCQGDYTIQAI